MNSLDTTAIAAPPAGVSQIVDGQPLGATLVENQAVFRVWAPHAEAVHVCGDFNNWQRDEIRLVKDDCGVWGIAVDEVLEGDGYLFSITAGDDKFDRIDPRAREVSNSIGHGIVRHITTGRQTDFQLPSVNELVIYELHLGTFAADDGRHGTFQTAIDRLDHLSDLGINAIELMPIAEFAGDISWGYNPAHPFAVESAYGGPTGLQQFIEACHSRGIGVILDVVYNHFGPSDLDLWRFDGWGTEGQNGEHYGGIYFYNDWRASTPWGETRPDYGRPEVRRYILDNVRMWVEEYGVDGLRLDMTLYMRHVDGSDDPGRGLPDGWSLTQEINDYCASRECPVFTVAEDLRKDASLTRPTGHGGAGFRSQWDAGFVHPVRAMLQSPSDTDRSPAQLREVLEATYDEDPFNRVIYTESHDETANGQTRLPAEIDPDDPNGEYAVRRSAMGAELMLLCPGIPMLFQGQEILETHWFDDQHPLNWDRAEQHAGLLQLYRDMVGLRTNRVGQTRGLTGPNLAILYQNDEQRVLAWHRWLNGGPGDDVVVVANLSSRPQTDLPIGFPAAGTWSVVFNGDSEVYGDKFGGHAVNDVVVEDVDESRHGLVEVGAYSCAVLVRTRE